MLGLGSNLGDRVRNVLSAATAMRALHDVAEARLSALYETRPVGGPPQPNYVNAALLIRTRLPPREILVAALAIEHQHGRLRRERFGPRTLDVDILWIEGEHIDEPSLTVPHARLHERAFALVPLLDLAPDAVDPRTGTPIKRMLARVEPTGVWKLVALAKPSARDIADDAMLGSG